LGCRGKLAEEDLQALTAQVRKLRVKTFIFEERMRMELRRKRMGSCCEGVLVGGGCRAAEW
jgi:hypothetical protein